MGNVPSNLRKPRALRLRSRCRRIMGSRKRKLKGNIIQEIGERAQQNGDKLSFPIKELLPELVAEIFEFALAGTWTGKTPALLIAVRSEPELYEIALKAFNDTNTIALSQCNDFRLDGLGTRARDLVKHVQWKFPTPQKTVLQAMAGFSASATFHQYYTLDRLPSCNDDFPSFDFKKGDGMPEDSFEGLYDSVRIASRLTSLHLDFSAMIRKNHIPPLFGYLKLLAYGNSKFKFSALKLLIIEVDYPTNWLLHKWINTELKKIQTLLNEEVKCRLLTVGTAHANVQYFWQIEGAKRILFRPDSTVTASAKAI